MKVAYASAAAAIAAGLLAAAPAHAYSIPVQNSSFETLPAGGLNFPCGGSCVFSYGLGIPDWSTTGYETGQWITGGYAGNPPAYDGDVLAFSNGGTIYQGVGTAVAGTTYTLQVEVLHRTDYPIAGTVQLEIGGSVVATSTTPDGGAGTWNDWIATYTATGADAGKALTILLTGTGPQGDFDDVRLNASGGAVPEASTWAMMLTGFGAMALMARRRGAPA
jgi:hypothetical protein